ncbi:hypothetical protein HOG16_03825 [Candidatus Woesearchaeota archaeon]|jgi:hypothetical protein|nr:hypothetical protein [Candidatus Woesearchaeota archaeon]MBT4321892.1 hypothetical protein [Candidatus Woesearchaeota archaeon]
MVDEVRLEKAIMKSWCSETSLDSENWSEKNPACGQCAITALVLNDYLGGKIIQSDAILLDGRTESHYFNSIGGEQIDITRRQFPEGTLIPTGMPKKKGFDSTREYVLSSKKTRDRYEILKAMVEVSLS